MNENRRSLMRHKPGTKKNFGFIESEFRSSGDFFVSLPVDPRQSGYSEPIVPSTRLSFSGA
jgi:hypothetical protein